MSFKLSSKLTLLLLSIFFTTPLLASTYIPLVNDMTMPDGKPLYAADTDLSTFVSNIYIFMIAICVGLAFLMLFFGGFEYMLSDAFTKKEDAISRMTNALIGLGLALSSWILLNTINPQLLSLKILNITNQVAIEGSDYTTNPLLSEDELKLLENAHKTASTTTAGLNEISSNNKIVQSSLVTSCGESSWQVFKSYMRSWGGDGDIPQTCTTTGTCTNGKTFKYVVKDGLVTGDTRSRCN